MFLFIVTIIFAISCNSAHNHFGNNHVKNTITDYFIACLCSYEFMWLLRSRGVQTLTRSVQLTVSSNNFSFPRPSQKNKGFGKEKFYLVNRSSKIMDNCDCIVHHPNIGFFQLSSTNCF